MGASAPVRTRPAEASTAGGPGPSVSRGAGREASPKAAARHAGEAVPEKGRQATASEARAAAGPAPRTALRPKLRSKVLEMLCSSPIRCTGALLVVAAVVFGLVLLNIHVAQTSFRLSDLQREAAELQQEQRRLRFEVARAESPDKIVEMSASLGLVPPPSQQFLEGPPALVAEPEPVVQEVAPPAATEQEPAAAQTPGSGG